MSYSYYEMEVVRWGEARGIVQNGTAISQAIKTLEETTELLDALNRKNLADTRDAIGDVVVTLLMVCAILDINLTDCLKDAYEEIKDRKGYLTPEGTFIKEVQ
jgi:phosphoribosyl-ATP pyrophosphohydrolase